MLPTVSQFPTQTYRTRRKVFRPEDGLISEGSKSGGSKGECEGTELKTSFTT